MCDECLAAGHTGKSYKSAVKIMHTCDLDVTEAEVCKSRRVHLVSVGSAKGVVDDLRGVVVLALVGRS
jgi:hypothetical protein